MNKPKIDLRIVKTRKAIKDSFLTLIQTKEYDRITIQDIADQAIINRNTFYLHYIDKPDLMEKLCIEHIDLLNICLPEYTEDVQNEDPSFMVIALKSLFLILEEHVVFFRTMLTHEIEPSFSSYLKDHFKQIILSGLDTPPDNLKIQISLEYMVSGLVGAISLWIKEPEHYSIAEWIEQLSNIHFNNILDLIRSINGHSVQ